MQNYNWFVQLIVLSPWKARSSHHCLLLVWSEEKLPITRRGFKGTAFLKLYDFWPFGVSSVHLYFILCYQILILSLFVMPVCLCHPFLLPRPCSYSPPLLSALIVCAATAPYLDLLIAKLRLDLENTPAMPKLKYSHNTGLLIMHVLQIFHFQISIWGEGSNIRRK